MIENGLQSAEAGYMFEKMIVPFVVENSTIFYSDYEILQQMKTNKNASLFKGFGQPD